ncbi:diaminopimelate epimerase [soil metagenome]
MPRLSHRFYRAHGLGNDYLVCETLAEAVPEDAGWTLGPDAVRTICRRGSGEGADGIVVLLDRHPAPGAPFPLRMFNPDGSEFERSGNGLRILASWLRREGLVGDAPFVVRSGGIDIPMQVHEVTPSGRFDVSVDMGFAKAGAAAVTPVGWTTPSGGASAAPSGGASAAPSGGAPDNGDDLETVHPELGAVRFVPVWVGNPHAVVFLDADRDAFPGADAGQIPSSEPAAELDGELLRQVGPFLATHPGFARGTNVQLARVLPDGGLEIGIWERGVGRTSASGTSSCAAAVAAVATGRIEAGGIPVRMPGGELGVHVTPDLQVTLRGPVQEVSRGTLAAGFLAPTYSPS